MRRTWALLLALGSISEAAAAQSPPPSAASVATEQHPATPDPHPWRARPFAIDANLGIATPFGLAGLSAEVAPIEYLSLGGGVGTNILGIQYAGMARLRFTPQRRNSYYFGAGYSQGRHTQSESNRDGVFSLFTGPLSSGGHTSYRGHDWKTARWFNAELGVERREQRGLDVRGFVGACFLLNPDSGVTDPQPSLTSQEPILDVRTFMIYAGTAIGFSL